MFKGISPHVRHLFRHPEKVRQFDCIRCNNSHHYIALVGKNLVLLNHNIGKELAAQELGAKPCECMRQLQGWRGSNRKRIFPSSQCDPRNPFTGNGAIGSYRNAENVHDYAGEELKDLAARVAQQVFVRVRLALKHKCDYTLLKQNKWLLSVGMVRVPKDPPKFHSYEVGFGYAADVGQFYTPVVRYIAVRIDVPVQWFNEVWKSGWSVASSHLVVGFTPSNHSPHEGIAKVLAERPFDLERKKKPKTYYHLLITRKVYVRRRVDDKGVVQGEPEITNWLE
jgi:hypothetical protein